MEVSFNLSVSEEDLRKGFKTPENFVDMIDELEQHCGFPPLTEEERQEAIDAIKRGGDYETIYF